MHHERAGIRNAAFGLTDDQARVTPTASALSIGGIVKHLVAVEHHWRCMATGEPLPPRDPSARESRFVLLPDQTLSAILSEYAEAAIATDGALREIDLDRQLPVPKGMPWYPSDAETWSVRWIVLHLIHETARHAGHADIIRESIDGATMFGLMQAVEGTSDAH